MTSSSAQEVVPASTPILPGETKIGRIGAGVMGTAMRSNPLGAGFRLCVHSRTKRKAEPLLEQGADWSDTQAEIAGQSDVIVTMLRYPYWNGKQNERINAPRKETASSQGFESAQTRCDNFPILCDNLGFDAHSSSGDPS